MAVSVGAKSTCRFWLLPAASTMPIAGLYVNVPETDAVALSWVPLSAVP